MEKNIYNSFKLHRISISCSYPLTMWCLLFPFQMMKTQSWLPGYHFLLCPFLSHCLSLTICIKPPVPSSCFLFFFFDTSPCLRSHLVGQTMALGCPWKPCPAPGVWFLCCSNKLATKT